MTPDKPSRGRKRNVGVGDRLTRSQIALRSKIDRETVTKYLSMDGAPAPDKNMCWSYAAAIEWIDKVAPRAGTGSDEQKKLRTDLLRVQLERAQMELAVDKGENIPRSAIAPAISGFMTKLTTDLVDIFEKELPSKCHGRTTIQIAELQAEGVDRVLKRLKAGAEKLVT